MYLRFATKRDRMAAKLTGEKPLLVYKTRDPSQHQAALQRAAREVRRLVGARSTLPKDKWAYEYEARSVAPKGFWAPVAREAMRQRKLWVQRRRAPLRPPAASLEARRAVFRGKVQAAVRGRVKSARLERANVLRSNGATEVRALFRSPEGWVCVSLSPTLRLQDYWSIDKPATKKRLQACLIGEL